MHLYNAVRQTSNMPAWEDMEYLIKQHTENYLFVGGRPTGQPKFMPKFLLAMGQSAENLARGGTRNKPENSQMDHLSIPKYRTERMRYLRQKVVLVKGLAQRYNTFFYMNDQKKVPDIMSILLAFAKKARDAITLSTDQKFPNSVQLLASLRGGVTDEG